MEPNEEDVEREGKQDFQSRVTDSADHEFQNVYGWITLGNDVAKEFGVSYFEVCDKPAVHVFVLAECLIEKVKKLEREIKKRNK